MDCVWTSAVVARKEVVVDCISCWMFSRRFVIVDCRDIDEGDDDSLLLSRDDDDGLEYSAVDGLWCARETITVWSLQL